MADWVHWWGLGLTLLVNVPLTIVNVRIVWKLRERRLAMHDAYTNGYADGFADARLGQ